MNPEWEPEFLTRQIVDAIHDEQINAFGGLHGVRDENALESAIMAAQNVYFYGEGEGCGISCSGLPEQQTYEAMIQDRYTRDESIRLG